MAFVVQSVNATANFPTTNSLGATPLIIPGAPIWNPTAHPPAWYIDGDGSQVPVTFQIPIMAAATYTVPIELEARMTFPNAWAGTYEVTAHLPGIVEPIFRSSGAYNIPAGGGQVDVNVPTFTMAAPFAAFACPVPFRLAGDFTWTISNVGAAVNTLNCAQTTRLELGWANFTASRGPLVQMNALLETAVDFAGSYPIGLLRMFWPTPADLATAPAHNFDQIAVNGPWYVARAMDRIWAWGTPHLGTKPQYDVVSGASFYNMGFYGGSFKLREWMAAAVPGARLNCYDLAAIAQLACAVYVDPNGIEVLHSRWVFQNPNGYILPGTIFGWEGYANCNNPYWGTFLPPNNSGPYVDPTHNPTAPVRYAFDNHAWVEVTYGPPQDARRVLDATHAVGFPPQSCERGARDRTEYFTAHIDTIWKWVLPRKYGNPANKGRTVMPNGSCIQNPDFQLNSQDLAQPNRLDRIGVQNVVGVGAVPVALPDPFLPAPPPAVLPGPGPPPVSAEEMRTDIHSLIARAKNPSPPSLAYSNALLNTDTVAPIVTGDGDLQHTTTILTLAPGVTESSMRFQGPEKSDMLILDVQVFDSYEDPVNAMQHHVSGYQVPKVLSPTETPLGQVSLQSPTSMFWVRGNVFVKLRHFPSDPLSATPLDLAAIALRFDQHLESAAVQPPSHARADTRLQTPAPKTVEVGEKFSLSLAEDSAAHSDMHARSSDASVIISEGPADENGLFNFYARMVGSVDITVIVAHEATLHPAFEVFQIDVVGRGGPTKAFDVED